MAVTLIEGNKYSNTTLAGYVIDRLAKDDGGVLACLPFTEILGNSYTYNTLTTDSGADFYEVGETWKESTPRLTPATAKLVILGGDADVDNFLKATRSNIIDLQGEVLNNKIKAVRNKFNETFFYGNATTNPKEFTGLQGLIADTTYNTVHAGTGTGSALSIAKLQDAIDLMKEVPNELLMTKKMRSLINVYLNSVGDKFVAERNQFGQMIEWFRGLPVRTTDFILNTETASSGAFAAATGGACTTIFLMKYDSKAICGLQGPNQVETIPIGDLETKDAKRWRIRWYCGLKFEDLRLAGKVDGIATASAVTA